MSQSGSVFVTIEEKARETIRKSPRQLRKTLSVELSGTNFIETNTGLVTYYVGQTTHEPLATKLDK